MSDVRDPDAKSEWVIEAEKALEAAKKMRPGKERVESLRKAGALRNEAVQRDLEMLKRRSK
jgi:hypothetical protein